MSDSKKSKTNKSKLIARYVILAACILLIAAVTVITVFAANNWFQADVSIDKPNTDEGNKPEDDKPTVVVTTFAMPLSDVDITHTCTVTENTSLCGLWEYHTGVDMKADAGTPVMCCLDGTIDSITVGHQLEGTTITVLHANGIKTVYRFVDAAENLKEGDKVLRGDVIGTVQEANGREIEQGAHLHFEVYENGDWKDPEDFLVSDAK